ncbi:ATP-dependent DNA helicase [Lacrimispora algidixylanolytica]|uniref:Helicase n=1 Tax=Lacrimispora algidixylanolytica TaxID=94868 RepID=A0A419T0H4_9FIRM|nr:ATP-dependent DNA helicase [Lacrimispora algidixylanolytica]RKD30957.1 helicase [Lacrimispora algidixylanolytica]
MADTKIIKISVRNLVEYVLRSGDIDNRRTQAFEKTAMQEGSRIHRKIQRRMGPDYRPEVSLKHTVDQDQFQILIEGRADGIIEKPEGVTIDEIKGVYKDLSYLEEPVPVHLAQAMCYGYFYCFDHTLAGAVIQMTYCNMETEEIRRFQVEKTFEELEAWFQGLIHEYVKWARYLYIHGLRRDESIQELSFPFPYRSGQKDLVVSVYRSIQRKRNLFIQAPTGVGKTLSTIFPAVRAMREGLGDKLFYLTAKTITRSVAEESFELLREQGLYLNTVTITAKEKLCFLDTPECNPDACPYAKGHFDRVGDGVYDIIHQETGITRDIVLAYAEKHQVCPFEFCLDISNWTDSIICDYNYVFDPNIRLKRYFSEGVSGEYLFLVDEAHNLVPRAREMYSAVLYKEDFLLVKKIIKPMDQKIARLLDRCNKELLEMKRECESYQILEDIRFFMTSILSLFGEMEKFMEIHQEFGDRDLVLDFYFALRDFINIYERVDENYRIYTELLSDGRFMLRLFCINPSRNLKECLNKGNGTIFFSATLLPVSYYKELLSGDQEEYAVYAHSPFDQEKRLLMVAGDVSSRYTRRNKREYQKVVDYFKVIVSEQKGNYMAFLPSYHYLKEVESVLYEISEESIGFTFLSQASSMNEAQREQFLKEFSKERDNSFVALCVMGGVFSEGIDLRADQLIGAIIVGTGLPMVCTEQHILKAYFDEKEQKGFDYAYQYPGMNKVMQAAGRVIRTVDDEGIIALLDERFLRPDYQALFPREWDEYYEVRRNNVGDVVKDFWHKREKKGENEYEENT